MNSKNIESLSFEDSYERLEEVIQKLEDSNLTIDESVALYEEGIHLAVHCDKQLEDAELKVIQLLTDAEESETGI